MADNSNKIKLAEQVLASHKSKLASAADKDQVRRSIDAAQQRLTELRSTHTPQVFNDRRT